MALSPCPLAEEDDSGKQRMPWSFRLIPAGVITEVSDSQQIPCLISWIALSCRRGAELAMVCPVCVIALVGLCVTTCVCDSPMGNIFSQSDIESHALEAIVWRRAVAMCDGPETIPRLCLPFSQLEAAQSAVRKRNLNKLGILSNNGIS